MPKPILVELRQRAVAAYEVGEASFVVIADRFGVSRRSLQRWVELHRNSGTVDPQPPGGGALSPVDMETLRGLIAARPDATTYELASDYNRAVRKGRRVHRSSIVRALQRAGYVFKKRDRARRNKIART